MWSSRYCRLPTRNPVVAIRVVMLVVCLITTVLACGRESQTTESSTLQDHPSWSAITECSTYGSSSNDGR